MKDKNKYYKSLSIVFILSLIGVVSLNILKSDILFSENENRMLAQKPKFSIDRLISGRYIKKYEKYKVDQFIGRDFFMQIKSKCELLIGKKENNGVYYGKDGYLIEKFNPAKEQYISDNIDAINNFSNIFNNINTYMAIVPTAISILDDKLPAYTDHKAQLEYINNFKSRLNEDVKYIDTYDILNESSDDYIYYKTDHHWTSKGAYYAFNKLKEDLNLKGDDIEYEELLVSEDFNGTLSSKSGFNLDIKDKINVYLPIENNTKVIINNQEKQNKTPSLYNSKNLQTKDKYSIFLDGNHPIIEISTTVKNDKELLIIKDSYANSVIPFLVEYYSKIVVVDPRYFYDDLYEIINNNNFNDILLLYNANTFFADKYLASVLNNQ